MNDKSSQESRICIGAFAGAHGVRGDAKVKCFTEAAENIASYGVVETEDKSRRFTLKFIRILKADFALVRAPEIKNREDAEALRGTRLYIERERLPDLDEDEFYYEDLIGLRAVDENGAAFGKVSAVYDFGAGPLIELSKIPGVKGVRLVEFTKKNAPHIDLPAGAISIMRDAIDLGDGEPEPADSAKSEN